MHSIIKSALVIGALGVPVLVFAQSGGGTYSSTPPSGSAPTSASSGQDVGGTDAKGQPGKTHMMHYSPSMCVGPVSYCTPYFGS